MLTKKENEDFFCEWAENKDKMIGWNFVKQTFIKAWEVTVDRLGAYYLSSS